MKRFAVGFSLVELIVVVAIVALLAALAMPELSAWISNTRVRSVAEALQNDLRKAQAEAVRRNHQAVLILTETAPTAANVDSVVPSAAGRNWMIRILPTFAGELATADTVGGSFFVKGELMGSQLNIIMAAGQTMQCFNSMGRPVANVSTVGTIVLACAAPAVGAPTAYDISLAGADRPLRVNVALGGQIRMCDPAKTLSATTPDGC